MRDARVQEVAAYVQSHADALAELMARLAPTVWEKVQLDAAYANLMRAVRHLEAVVDSATVIAPGRPKP